MFKRRLRDNDAVYTDIKSLELHLITSTKVAASLTKAVVKDLIHQVREENPDASKEEILAKVREIMTL